MTEQVELPPAQLDALRTIARVAETKYSYARLGDLLNEATDGTRQQKRDFERRLGLLVCKEYLKVGYEDEREVYQLTDDGLSVI